VLLSAVSQSSDYQDRFGGIARLTGNEGLERLRAAHVCVIGLGGVGSWTAEALARSGIGALTLIDLDEICVSNINRQVPALSQTIGQSKIQVLAERIRGINPECPVTCIEEFFTAANADRLLENKYKYLVDAIDSLANKCLLIAKCQALQIPVITAGGAGGRRDPTKIKIADLAFASHDRLLSSVRKLLRSDYGFPNDHKSAFGVPSVFSSEAAVFPQSDGTMCTQRGGERSERRINCNSGYGSAVFVTGTFGFVAAAHVVSKIAAGR
jgi:tRNA threonylcarbamoyladenosine dehydratase